MSEKLYQECPACCGTGILRNAVSNIDPVPRDRACPGCKPLRVVETGLTAGQVEGIVKQRQSYLAQLQVLADGCQRRQQAYGIPYAKTCRRCGLAGPCVFGEPEGVRG